MISLPDELEGLFGNWVDTPSGGPGPERSAGSNWKNNVPSSSGPLGLHYGRNSKSYVIWLRTRFGSVAEHRRLGRIANQCAAQRLAQHHAAAEAGRPRRHCSQLERRGARHPPSPHLSESDPEALMIIIGSWVFQVVVYSG